MDYKNRLPREGGAVLMKTARGFEVVHFKDDYGIDCSIQESSAVEPHIWLGVHNPDVSIMYNDLDVLSDISVVRDDAFINRRGWCTLNIPDEVRIFSRMHLNQKQAKVLIKQLKYFVKTGRLPEES